MVGGAGCGHVVGQQLLTMGATVNDVSAARATHVRSLIPRGIYVAYRHGRRPTNLARPGSALTNWKVGELLSLDKMSS
jgi:hypothetical protein